jgi:hypothetical protein
VQQHDNRSARVSTAFQELDLLAVQDDLLLPHDRRPRRAATDRRACWVSAVTRDTNWGGGHVGLPRADHDAPDVAGDVDVDV